MHNKLCVQCIYPETRPDLGDQYTTQGATAASQDANLLKENFPVVQYELLKLYINSSSPAQF